MLFCLYQPFGIRIMINAPSHQFFSNAFVLVFGINYEIINH